ncbi:tetratricopeptide repeat protein [Ketobacter alkanivorans]|uniref:Tetratricopeptide repeat protein n=1 Tax=Ketobacter alkanivorans TaxID=1917421 RepID=A0A2K9LQ85_9GAMM|nr:hypothetical protein [Ketobacter alkanivorans]AUM14417.1 hypothetical protein Kalk_19165 [Ketobacter alkanivorans]MCP5017007.1 hypothetical protein [Ketobacter sp.]
MARQFCKYHPLEPALWYSPKRHIAFCERCVDSGETLGGMGQARCFVSGEELDYLGSANTAQPFWDRLGAFFRYPFKPDSLIVIGVFVLVAWALVGLMDLTSLPIMLIAGLCLLACITRYGFMIIEYSAEGRFDPPTLQETFSESGFNVLVQQVVVQLIFAGFTIAVALLNSDFLNVLANALVLFVAPASMMLLATEKTIGAAIVPGSIAHLIRSVGWSYLLLYAFLFLLLGAEAALFEVFVEEVPPQYFVPLFVGVTLYFMMVGYHLMGYVIFQYQSEIGFVAEDQMAREKRRLNIDPVDAKTELLVKDGQYQKAADTLTRHLMANPKSVRHHEKLSKLLLALQDKDQALAHGQRFMSVLHELGDESRLYFLFCGYEQLEPSFKPEDPDVLLSLADQLYNRGKFQQVCHLLANLHKVAPHFKRVPDAYLIMAKALLEGFKDSYKSSQYLKYIKAKHPDFKQLAEVDRLLAQCST